MKKALGGLLLVIVLIALGVWYIGSRSPALTGIPQSVQPIATALYGCNSGATINASFYEGSSTPSTSRGHPPTPGGSVQIVLSDGRSMTLEQTISADGARYANPDGSFVFWSKGSGALVLENNVEKNYTGCIVVAPEPAGSDLPDFYTNAADGFSIRLPSLATSTSQYANSYNVDESYQYQALGPGKGIDGVKFTIPSSLTIGTNLADDTYLSVELLSPTQNCTANPFLGDPRAIAQTLTDAGTTYSVASTTDAAAGNRYEETVYAIPGTNPCIAVRYSIHYGVIENYPPSVHAFDEQSLLTQFDQIRRTLVIDQ